MSGGEVVKSRLYAIRLEEESTELPSFVEEMATYNFLAECCYFLEVFAYTTDTNDYYRNDVSSFLFDFSLLYVSANIKLQKCVNGAWVDQATLTDDTYGVSFDFAFENDDFNNTNYIGYQIHWHTVFTAFGTGIYRVISVGTKQDTTTLTKSSMVYHLRAWNGDVAKGTVRFDFYLNGVLGDISDKKRKFDYKELNWFNQIRLRGIFGNETSPQYEREFNRYNNGEQVYINDNMKNEYTFNSYKEKYHSSLHNFVKTSLIQSDLIKVTNYDEIATGQYLDFEVVCASGYEPKWKYGLTTMSAVEVKFQDRRDIYRKKRER
jgi:hypothetical protein